MLRKTLIFVLIWQFIIGSNVAFSQTSPQFETPSLSPSEQLALDVFKDGKAAHDGINMPQDFQKARMLYLQAAELGSTEALINLGYLYFIGQGVESNHIKAREFYEIAAKRGSVDAKENLRMMDIHGLGGPPVAKPDTLVIPHSAIQQTAPSIDERTVPESQAASLTSETTPNTSVKTGITQNTPNLMNSELNSDATKIGLKTEAPKAASLLVSQAIGTTSITFGQKPSLIFGRSEKIPALFFSLVALLSLIYFFIDRKRVREREIRKRFMQYFYEAKRNDLRLTYLHRRNNDFVQATFYKEWHATLTALMARYALNFDEPDKTMRAFHERLKRGINLRLRPTQYLASEYSDDVIQAVQYEIKAVDAFHIGKVVNETEGLNPKEAPISTNPLFKQNVVRFLRKKSA